MQADFEVESCATHLDLFSTSPTFSGLVLDLKPLSPTCIYGAPFFAYEKTPRRYRVVQGCCNHWDCPRCGLQVAKQHYGRIVEGCRTIAKDHDLWFITITCRGADLSEAEAAKNYLSWSSKFLDACYAKSKRAKEEWVYVQVTEKQKRGHPHSHILTTFAPKDVCEGTVKKWRRDNIGNLISEDMPALRSNWLEQQSIRSGLGSQYDISKVHTVEAASRYVAKYMFKDSQFAAHFPKNWKRVRYSQSFPKLPTKESNAFVLLSADDWRHLASIAAVVDATTGDDFQTAHYFLYGHDVIVNERPERDQQVDKPQLNGYA